MNLPNVITQLVAAQNMYNSDAYASCFTESATVLDEGNTYNGRPAIKKWIAKANDTFKTVMKPLSYSENNRNLRAEISGNFPGSPLVLTYQFEFNEEKIQSLKII